MGYAGTPGMVWGWLIAMFFIQCVAMSMAELCSSMPTSGGLYYASAVSRLNRDPSFDELGLWLEGTCAPGLWTPRSLAYGMVELARTSHWRSFRRLWYGSHDTSRSLNWKPGIRPRELPNIPPHRIYSVHSRMHQQHADQMDCEFQLCWIQFEHRWFDRCDYTHSSSDQSRRSRLTEIYSFKRCVGKFLRGNGFPGWPCHTHDFCGSHLDDEASIDPMVSLRG